jgi:ribulose-phosphate 3-epimerase
LTDGGKAAVNVNAKPEGPATGDRLERWNELRRGKRVLPSLLSADFANLDHEIERMTSAGARALHLDVMDGHFVPNITFGPAVVAAIRRHTDMWLDAHLMVTDPEAYLDAFAGAGADSITIHVETAADLPRCREKADRLGVRLGLAIRPDRGVEEALDRSGDLFDLILVMTVMPGFGGQAYVPGSGERIEKAAAFATSSSRRPVVEVDGGIAPGTAADAARAGAEWFVVGNAIFRNSLPEIAFRTLQSEVEEARRPRQ